MTLQTVCGHTPDILTPSSLPTLLLAWGWSPVPLLPLPPLCFTALPHLLAVPLLALSSIHSEPWSTGRWYRSW